MKFSVILIILFFHLQASAEENFFAEKYPSFDDYQGQALQGLINYFSSFYSRSIITEGNDHTYRFDFQNDSWQTTHTLIAGIKRTQLPEKLVEAVSFQLSNGNRFDYILEKFGTKDFTSDDDLLKFNFRKGHTRLLMNALNAWFDSSDNQAGKLYFGMMELSINVETRLNENGGIRNYIYFYKGMPNPQSVLSVEAIKKDELVQFIHSSRGTEIAPKYFFQGLSEGATTFDDFSQISLNVLNSYGFPAIKGIN